ncbi:hypothetical protein ACFLZD_00195 [Candidatus Neomarinimicrobiota bacterium]
MQSQAIPSVLWDTNEYIDTSVELDKEYLYEIMASDKNYQTIGGLQHWSPRSVPTTITVGSSLISLSCPSNFAGHYIPDSLSIHLTWNQVVGANYYTIFKSFINPKNSNWVFLAIPVGNVYEYHDIKLLKNLTYFYQIISINGNIYSDRSSTIMVTSGTPSVEDEEYWEDVEEYENDRKLGWFGCSAK